MKPGSSLLSLLGVVVAAASPRAQGNAAAEPLVFVVADGARGDALAAMLREGGLRQRLFAPARCAPETLRLADVVVVDWPEDVPFDGATPLGELERWDRPTVFLGSSGDRFARRWRLPTAAEMVALKDSVRGPELQHFAPVDGATTGVERQGHLFHFACAASPVDFTPAERTWFAAVVREAARFVCDRPIVRHATADGAPLPEAERERRRLIDLTAQRLTCDVRDLRSVLAQRRKMFGADKSRVVQLFDDLLTPGLSGPDGHAEWLALLGHNEHVMVWDELSFTWRRDPLAIARDTWTGLLRGGKRIDGQPRSEAVRALVAKIAQRYGVRAFEDMGTFRCRRGNLCCLWDRRGGWFRVEDHGRTRRRGNEVEVLDTTTGAPVATNGGGPPLARVTFEALLVRVFLPVLLGLPGTAVEVASGVEAGDRPALIARFAHPCLEARIEYRIVVAPDSGDIVRVDQRPMPLGAMDRHDWRLPWELEGTEPCGLMTLPTAWSDEALKNGFVVDEARWNPELPADLATATDKLTEPRDR